MGRLAECAGTAPASGTRLTTATPGLRMTARTSAVGLEPPSESGDPAGRYHEQTRTRPLRRRFALLPARRGSRPGCVLLHVVVDLRPARQEGPGAMGKGVGRTTGREKGWTSVEGTGGRGTLKK